ncbi:MAG: leucyl aminopeptidase family protein [Planctomycetes bacterium]|nr:leucyl aminopeptidase family protein [Planctomycetota bacterium]
MKISRATKSVKTEYILCSDEDVKTLGFAPEIKKEIKRQLKTASFAVCPSLGLSAYQHIAVVKKVQWSNNNHIRRCYGKLAFALQKSGATSIHLFIDAKRSEDLASIALQGFAQGVYRFDRYLKKSKHHIEKVVLSSSLSAKRFKSELAVVESIQSCRDLINIPAEDMGPDHFVQAAKKLCKGTAIQVKVMDAVACKRAGMGALLAVGRASPRKPRLLILEFHAAGNNKKKFHALCGKGVCFDTGGLGIKPSKSMELMRKDMGGAATVLNAFVAAVRGGLKKSVRVYLPLVENNIDGNAFRPGDIVTAADGTTIEIGHTDAEGRLVLADAMTQARSDGARSIATVATLTGAAMVALGRIHVPLMGDDDAHMKKVLLSAQNSGEKMWQQPLEHDHLLLMRSANADISNTGSNGEAGCISAGAFLQHFAHGTPFMHMDISPCSWSNKNHDLGPQGATGVLVHSLCSFMLSL